MKRHKIIEFNQGSILFVFLLLLLQGETQDCEMSMILPCPKTCKNLWRSCVDHHSFFCSNRSARSPKHNNSTIHSYTKLITQHLGLGHTKNERWAWKPDALINSFKKFESSLTISAPSGPVCQRVVGGMVWNPVLRRSISSECLETKSLPSRSPPSTPNWYGPQLWLCKNLHPPSVYVCKKIDNFFLTVSPNQHKSWNKSPGL